MNADEALKILEARSDIVMLFSDIQMPGTMDGLKLAHAVHARWPSIKIILVSGQIKLADADKLAYSLFFGKPLIEKDMIAELQAMIGAGPKNRAEISAVQVTSGSRLSVAQELLTAENEG